jgi:hypothetical protein
MQPQEKFWQVYHSNKNRITQQNFQSFEWKSLLKSMHVRWARIVAQIWDRITERTNPILRISDKRPIDHNIDPTKQTIANRRINLKNRAIQDVPHKILQNIINCTVDQRRSGQIRSRDTTSVFGFAQ